MSDVNSGFSIYDVLFLIGLQARTGELVMESGNNIGSILLHDGAILQAFSPYSRAIGDLLVEESVITESELLEALHVQKNDPNIPLGTVLLKTGRVSFDMVERLVHDQIRKAVEDFRAWQNIHFSFIPKAITPFDRIHLPIHEFIRPDAVKTALTFLADKLSKSQPPRHSSPQVTASATLK